MSLEPQPPRSEPQYSSPDAFARLAETFESLRVLAPDAREQQLQQLEARDPGITTTLRSLLAQHDEDPDALAAPDRAFAPTVVAEAIRDIRSPDSPTSIGPYKVLHTLGHGGMGSVYLGEHTDPDLHRRVALKVLRTARHDPDVVRRFRIERRILGALQHPNIATLYEGGSTEDGQPYVAMEYVDGRDLLSHAESNKLDIDARIRLFVKVCRAVAHAHRALVVHRDLKPSNVLVTAAGEPKLLDFGIAKLLEVDDGEDTTVVTRTGHMMLTPEYCSPEQVRSEAITTSTDVYALGVLLYELLTGERAQPRAGTSMQDLLQVVCERTPPAASAAVRRGPMSVSGRPEPRTRWSRRLDGDLDTILATAMQKDPARRYATAEALAEDLEHHLLGRPVAARPDTLAYRTRKFVRRNRVPVAGAAVFVITLATFALVTASDNVTIQRQLTTIRAQNETIKNERDAARDQTAVADRVVAFMTSLYDMAAPDPNRAETLRARELLDRGARRIARELADLPAQRAPLQLAMGHAYVSLGLYQDAEQQLVAAERTLAELGRDNAAHREGQFLLGGLRLCQGNFQRGEQLMRQSWQATQSGPALDPVSIAARQLSLVGWLRDAGRLEDALTLLAKARQIPDTRADDVARAGAELDMVEASVLRCQGKLDRARELAVTAIQHAEARDGKGHGRHANLYRELAQIHQDLGELDQAREALQQALRIDRKLSGEDHPDVEASLFAVAMIEIDRGAWREAETLLREVLTRDQQRFGELHPSPALTMSQLATVLGNLGEAEEAEPMFLEALTLQRKLLPEGHPEIATTLANMASFFNRLRRYDEAAPCLEQALALRLQAYDEEHPAVLTTRQQIAVVELGRGNSKAAEAQFRTLLKLRRKVRGDHPETAGSLLSLATCIARQGRPEEAIPMFRESAAMFRRTLPEGHETVARPLLGEALARLRIDGLPSKSAESLLREAEQLRLATLGEGHPRTLYTQYWLVRCLIQNQKLPEARQLATATVAMLRQHRTDDQLLARTEQLLASLKQ